MAKVMSVINWVGGAGIAFVFFYAYSNRTWGAAFWWGLFYVSAAVFPAVLSARASRRLAALDPPVPRAVRQIAFFPIWAAYVVMLAALILIRHTVQP